MSQTQTDEIDIESVARAVLKRADLDLNGESPRQRISAYHFFTRPSSHLELWCKVLGITPEGVRTKMAPSLRKFELDNKKERATLTK
jgi:hypothetical protein